MTRSPGLPVTVSALSTTVTRDFKFKFPGTAQIAAAGSELPLRVSSSCVIMILEIMIAGLLAT